MWHTHKSRWVTAQVVGLGTTIAEDLQMTNGPGTSMLIAVIIGVWLRCSLMPLGHRVM
jgi:hypothetical protein